MSDLDITQVIKEVRRVLKGDGYFEIWDIEMPSIKEVEEDIFIAQLDIRLNESSITNGYGVQLKENQQTRNQISGLLKDYGFSLTQTELYENGTFYLEAKKS